MIDRVTEDIEIHIEGEGFPDIEALLIKHSSNGRDVLQHVALKTGASADELLLFVEDGEDPIDLDMVLEAEKLNHTLHVHTARRIEVEIYYQGGAKSKAFAPSTRVRRVLDWAVGKRGFNIDPTIAPEMELSLHGQNVAMPHNAHIGRFVQGHKGLVLDLIRGVIPNGASNG